MALQPGVYNFQWSGGVFEVEFRKGGTFWCRKFANDAKWEQQDAVVRVDWGKYGKYELAMQPDGSLSGGVLGKPEDWRKAVFVRAFTPTEELLSGSAWMLHYENGVPFRVEFHADGHFHSADYAGHHLWKLDGNKVAVDWGKYGQYDLEVDPNSRQAAGSLRGNPASWRKLQYVEPLPAYIFKANSCGHSH
mmetsp:Transcript_23929/g.77241  ORF Transcript_23929/g.77241 Transcript_23929/m.77241 type:complete len:191 (+) Transcript_23929:51-623(+)